MAALTLAHVRHYLERIERVHGPDVPLRVAPLPDAHGVPVPWLALVDVLLTLHDGRAMVLLIPGPGGEGGAWR